MDQPVVNRKYTRTPLSNPRDIRCKSLMFCTKETESEVLLFCFIAISGDLSNNLKGKHKRLLPFSTQHVNNKILSQCSNRSILCLLGYT